MTIGKTIALSIQTFVNKVMYLLFNKKCVVISFSRGSSWLRDPTCIFGVSCTGFFTSWALGLLFTYYEAPGSSLSLSLIFLTLTRSSQTSNYCPLWIAIFIVWLIYKSNSKCLNWNLEEWVQINLKKFACTFLLYVLLISDCNIYDSPYILKKFSPGI